MPKVEVKNGDIETALRNFKRITSETEKSRKKHEFYLRPGLRKKEKEKAAAKKRNKYNKRNRQY
ncbi:MAG: 30S ribosomal protein S21 [Malacoplasma sp.]